MMTMPMRAFRTGVALAAAWPLWRRRRARLPRLDGAHVLAIVEGRAGAGNVVTLRESA
jgi:hypothetical protein